MVAEAGLPSSYFVIYTVNGMTSTKNGLGRQWWSMKHVTRVITGISCPERMRGKKKQNILRLGSFKKIGGTSTWIKQEEKAHNSQVVHPPPSITILWLAPQSLKCPSSEKNNALSGGLSWWHFSCAYYWQSSSIVLYYFKLKATRTENKKIKS
jgi:hypothetical protein